MTKEQKDPERIEIIEKTLELLIKAILDGEDRDHDSWIRHTLIPTAKGLLAMTARRLQCPKCASRVIDYEINDEDYVRSAKCLKCNYIWEDCEQDKT